MTADEVSILVVDDVNTMRVQIKELLKSFGFRKVTMASSGQEAMGMIETDQFHLIMCDWHMVPTDGMEFLTYIRKHPEYSKVPFIMITAEATKEKVVAAIKGGVDDYLMKPLTAAQIQTKVYAVLQKKKVLL